MAGRNLPGRPALFCNHRQMANRAASVDQTHRWGRRLARRDHHLDLNAVRGDCLVGGRAIIRTIGRHLANRRTPI
jgi:hypothetical protein